MADEHDSVVECWAPIPGYEGKWEVSNQGRVRSVDRIITQVQYGTLCHRRWRGRILKPQPSGGGYLQVPLGDRNLKLVHGLVLLTFVGKPPLGHEACHNDGNKKNNYLQNLRYDWPANNQADRILHETHNRGERNGIAKLTRDQALTIRDSDLSRLALAKMFGVSRQTIDAIKNNKVWAWLNDAKNTEQQTRSSGVVERTRG